MRPITWIICVNFLTLFSTIGCCQLLSKYRKRLGLRSVTERADVSDVNKDPDFLKLLFQLSAFQGIHSSVPRLTDKTVESLVSWVFGRIKRKLSWKEPLRNDFTRSISFSEQSLNFNGTFEHLIINQLSSIELDRIKSLVKNNTVQFAYKIPRIETHNTRYELDGKIYGINIRGKGHVSVNVTGVEISGMAKYSLNRWKNNAMLQFKEMGLQYWLDDFKIKITGLQVPSIIENNINPLLSSIMTKYLQDEEENVSERLSELARTRINQRLKESTIIDRMRFIWEWIV